MPAPNQVTGKITVTVDGTRLASKEGAKLMMGGATREPVVLDDGSVNFSEKLGPGGVECTIVHKKGTSLKQLQGITNSTLLFETDTGTTYMVRNAFVQNALELAGGEVTLQFAGDAAEEL